MSGTDKISNPVLEISGVTAGYGPVTIVRDLSFCIEPGEVVALLGPNGAGKTTTLSVIAGMLIPTAGTVKFGGVDITRLAPHRRSSLGLCLIPEGRGIFPTLTVAENLRLQTPPGANVDECFDRALDVFPQLRPLLRQAAGRLSGGQQQMVALARTCTTEPRLIMVDEASMGLAPLVVDEIFGVLKQLSSVGVAMIVVEQYVRRALDLADSVMVMRRGGLECLGPSHLLDEDTIGDMYLSTV